MLRSPKSLVLFAILALLTVSIGVSPDTPEATASSPAIETVASALAAPTAHERVGLVDPTTGIWYLESDNGAVSFYYGNPGDYPMMGDWDCSGSATPGLYRQSDGYVYLRNSNTQGIADIKFYFGNPGDIPIAGDFNGDGCDTVSIYRQTEGQVYIVNKLGENNGGLGAADYHYYFGNPGDKPFVGDFNGDGVDTVGLHRESTGYLYFRNTNTQGIADFQFYFGNPGDRLIAGDWTGDGSDTPAVYRPGNTTFYYRYTNTQGNADSSAVWGRPGWLPVAGVPHLAGGEPLPGPLYPGPAWPTSLNGVAYASDVPADLQSSLASDGFVVNPTRSRPHMAWIYEGLYPYGGRPMFVTTDAAYHHWHLVFDKVLRDVEQLELLPELESLLTGAVACRSRSDNRALRDSDRRCCATRRGVLRSHGDGPRPQRRTDRPPGPTGSCARRGPYRPSGLPDRRRVVPSRLCRLLEDDARAATTPGRRNSRATSRRCRCSATSPSRLTNPAFCGSVCLHHGS